MVEVNITPINITAELQKVALGNALTQDQHADLRVLILDAAAAIGMDGGGKDGLMGYLKYAASTFPKQYMALISKVLPLQIDSKSTVNIIEHVNIVSVPPWYICLPGTLRSHYQNHRQSRGPKVALLSNWSELLDNPTPVDPFAA